MSRAGLHRNEPSLFEAMEQRGLEPILELTPAPEPTRPQEVLDTSIAVFEEIKPKLGKNDAEILELLALYPRQHGDHGTGKEIEEMLKARYPHRRGIDPNNVRPAITRLRKTHKLVAFGEKRKCTVTKKKVYTWRALVRFAS